MRVIGADELDALLTFPRLIEALRGAFASGGDAPERHHHAIGGQDGGQGGGPVHLLMPAWTPDAPAEGSFLGTKIVNAFPNNGRKGLPAIHGTYLLQSGETGEPLAVLDGTRLTHWRTAAASALAARFLARPDAARLLMVGSGALAPFLVRAHAAVSPLREILLWNHRRGGAEALAGALAGNGWAVTVVDDLRGAVEAADIVSCATLSSGPLVRGAWLRPGTHVDLVGAFTLGMRETDGEAVSRARVFVDTPAALIEGGDVALAIRDGAITAGHVAGNLFDLCAGRLEGRRTEDEVTLFKSVGTGIEDLAAAILVWRHLQAAG